MKNVYIAPCSSQLDSVVFIVQGVLVEFFSRSYPDLVAPCFGIHPLQGGEGGEQRSARPQVVKQSAPHPSLRCFTLLILRVTVSRLLSGKTGGGGLQSVTPEGGSVCF